LFSAALQLQNQALDGLGSAWGKSSGLIFQLGGALVVLLVFLVLARILRNLVNRMLARRSIRSDAGLLLTRAIWVGVLTVGGIMALSIALGSQWPGVTGVLVVTVVTSLGVQDVVKNYVSGFYVLMEKNVRVGDLVDSGGYRGVVTDVRMRVTYLQGAHGEMIVVPNSELFTKTLAISQAPPDWGSAPEGAEHDANQGVEAVAR
jgi:small conductance mechanosensitive channel